MRAIIIYTPLNRVFHVTPLALPDLIMLFAATAAFTLLGLAFGKSPAKIGHFQRYPTTG